MTTTEESVSLWQPDVLGHGYERMDLPLKADEEGPVKATLVRHAPPVAHPSQQGVLDFLANFTKRKRRPSPSDPGGAPRVVLYLHGWADYFLQTELAEYLTASGFHFYALDLRKFGRSLLPGQTPGYTSDLGVYDDDIAAALREIERDVAVRTNNATPPTIHMLAHSLGGLIAALWADRNPGRLGTLVLNSPWLELQGSSLVRSIAMHLVGTHCPDRSKTSFQIPGNARILGKCQQRGTWRVDAGSGVASAGFVSYPRGMDKSSSSGPRHGGAQAQHRRPGAGAFVREDQDPSRMDC